MSEEEVPAGPPAWPGGATYSNDPWGSSDWTPAPPMSGWWSQQYYTYEPPPPPRRTSRVVMFGVFIVIFVFVASAAATAVIATRGIGGSGSTSGVEAATVDINTSLGGGSAAAGTGMVLTSSGVILTNDHVVAHGIQPFSVRLTSTGASYPATLIGEDGLHDVAVIQLEGVSGLATAPIGDSSTVHVGDSVTALGNAEGRGGAPAVANGQVTALGQSITASDQTGQAPENLTGMIQTNAPILPGDSGGPLVNGNGQVIGMDTAASGGRRGPEQGSIQAFAIPIDTALNYAHQLIAHPTAPPAPALLGVCVGPSTSPQGAVLVAGAPCGANGVESGTPAATTALRAGDVITSVGGAAVLSDSSLRAILEGDHPGQSVVIVWTDPNGQQHRAPVTLAAAQQ
jgi:S1-C subfamily serine protease